MNAALKSDKSVSAGAGADAALAGMIEELKGEFDTAWVKSYQVQCLAWATKSLLRDRCDTMTVPDVEAMGRIAELADIAEQTAGCVSDMLDKMKFRLMR